MFLSAATILLCMGASAQPRDDDRPDTVGTGAFPAMKEEVSTLPDHVIYRPQNLAALGSQKLGVMAWGNGSCTDDAASNRFHLLEIASHGYLVIASGSIYSGLFASGYYPPIAYYSGASNIWVQSGTCTLYTRCFNASGVEIVKSYNGTPV